MLGKNCPQGHICHTGRWTQPFTWRSSSCSGAPSSAENGRGLGRQLDPRGGLLNLECMLFATSSVRCSKLPYTQFRHQIAFQ